MVLFSVLLLELLKESQNLLSCARLWGLDGSGLEAEVGSPLIFGHRLFITALATHKKLFIL